MNTDLELQWGKYDQGSRYQESGIKKIVIGSPRKEQFFNMEQDPKQFLL